jgi:hypothetical protein
MNRTALRPELNRKRLEVSSGLPTACGLASMKFTACSILNQNINKYNRVMICVAKFPRIQAA